MIFRDRSDGTRIKGLDPVRQIMPYLMKNRVESTIFSEQEIDVTETIKYIRQHNRSKSNRDEKITLFHIFLCSYIRTVALRPQLNRFVSGSKYYQRNSISLNFIAKKTLTDDAEELNVKIAFSPVETLLTLPKIVNHYITKAKSQEGNINEQETAFLMKFPRPILKLIMSSFRLLDFLNIAPKSMIEMDPLYSTMFITNLTSLGLEAPLHHLFEWGNNGLFVALGKVKKVNSLNARGELITRDIMHVNYSIDDRMSDGLYCARALKLVKEFVENPIVLETKPEIPEETLKELKLKPVENTKGFYC